MFNITITKQVPPESIGGKILFATPDGKFFNAKGRQLKHAFSPACAKRRGGSAYPYMVNFGARLCHHLIYETFIGPRTPGMEIDHINGDKFDYSVSNLQEITPAENRRRAKILRQLRAKGIDPTTLTSTELQQHFKTFQQTEL